ncbi:MAG: DegV family protein [Dehalococcoidia bacterium]
MERFAIVTDSAACIPQELRERYRILVVPLVFLAGGISYRDGDSLSGEEFYRLLTTSSQLPTTTATPPGDFLAAFRQAYHQSHHILSITIGSNFSGNYASACNASQLAQQELPQAQVRVLDSRNAAMAEGFVVLAAAQAAAQGCDMEQAVQRAQAVIPRTYLLGVLDDLYYVARSGRVPRIMAWASSLLQIKPILQFHDGEVIPLERVRTKPRAQERLLHLMDQRLQPAQPLHVAVLHAHAPDEAASLAQRVQERFATAELLVTEFSQVMGIHSGPGLVGLAFYNG